MSDDTLEQAVQRVLAAGLSTGHADSWEQLLEEVIVQCLEYRGMWRKCAGLDEAERPA